MIGLNSAFGCSGDRESSQSQKSRLEEFAWPDHRKAFKIANKKAGYFKLSSLEYPAFYLMNQSVD